MTVLYDSDWLQEQLAHTLTLLEGAWASLARGALGNPPARAHPADEQLAGATAPLPSLPI